MPLRLAAKPKIFYEQEGRNVMKRNKFLAALLTLVMLLSLVPVTALATDEPVEGETPATEDSDIKYGHYEHGYYDDNDEPVLDENGEMQFLVAGKPEQELPEGVVSLDKVAEATDDPYTYNITLTVKMEQKTESVAPGAAATVLAIDCSNSMDWCSVCGNEDCTCTNFSYKEVTGRKSTLQHYYVLVENEYVEVEYCNGWHFWAAEACPGGAGWYPVGLGYNHTAENRVADGTKFYTRVSSRGDGVSRFVVAKAAAIEFLQSYSGYANFNDDGSLNTTENLSYGRYLSVVLFETNAKAATTWVDVSTVAGYNTALQAIKNAQVGGRGQNAGGTNLDAALQMADDLLDSAPANVKNTVVLTDGEPTFYVGNNGSAVKDTGSSCGEQTFKKTIESADTLKNNGEVKLYTVYFGKSTDEMRDYSSTDRNATITLSNYLKNKIATAGTDTETYAYTASDSAALIDAFKAIGSSITSGLNAGVVNDALYFHTSTADEAFSKPDPDELFGSAEMTWELKAEEAVTETKDGVTTYTWTKRYTVTIDPDKAIGMWRDDLYPEYPSWRDKSVEEGADDYYRALNMPTTLTVGEGENETVLAFPIPCVKLPTPATVDLNGNPETDEDGEITGYKGLIFKNLSFTEDSKGASKVDGYDFEVTVTASDTDRTYTGTIEGMQPGTDHFSFARGTLTFRKEGTYTYTITETNGGDDDIIYDTDIITMTVKVEYDKETNALVPTVSFEKTSAPAEEEEPAPAMEIVPIDPVVPINPMPGEQNDTFYNLIDTVVEPTPGKPIKPAPEPEEPETGTLTITKSVVGNDLAAVPDSYKAVFKLVKDNKTVKEGIEVNEFTGLTGSVTVEDLAPGTYTVVETSASEIDGYTLNENISPVGESHVATVTTGGTASVTYTNCYEKPTINPPIEPPTPPAETGSIKITKVVEIEGLEALPANYVITFAVKSGDETVETATVRSFEKTANGFVGTTTIEKINVGTYTVVEQNPPAIDGYRGPTFKRDENNTAVVTKDGTAEVTVTNAYVSNQPSEPIEPPTPPTPPTQHAYYTISHFTSDDNGATYKLYASSDFLGDVGTNVTASVMTIEGYDFDHADPASKSITVSANESENVIKLYYKTETAPDNPNPPVDPDPVDPPYVPTTGSVDIRKTDAESGAKLAGATFALYRVTNAGDEFVKSVTTNAAGQATASGLTPGKYVAIETVAPEGYVLDDTRHEFTVTAGAVATKLAITNDKSDSVSRHEAYIIGYPDGTVRPTGNLSRAEAATIFFRLLADDVREANMTDVNPFSDVPAGLWCNHAISTLYELGIIDPAETFRPDDTITRSEFAALAERFGKVVKAEEFGAIATWVGSDTHYAAALGLSSGSFPADEPIARAEAMALVNRVLGRVPQGTGSLLANMITWPDNTDVTAWFYIAVQEATNSHDANKLDVWQVLRAVRNWAALEF